MINNSISLKIGFSTLFFLILILSTFPSTLLGEPLALPKIVSEKFKSKPPKEALSILIEISHTYLLESEQIQISSIHAQVNLQNILKAIPILQFMDPALEPLKNVEYKIRSNGEFCYFYPLNIYIKYAIKEIHHYFSRNPDSDVLKSFLTILETTSLILDEHLNQILKEIDCSDVTIADPPDFLN
jgi:hypothetical protein